MRRKDNRLSAAASCTDGGITKSTAKREGENPGRKGIWEEEEVVEVEVGRREHFSEKSSVSKQKKRMLGSWRNKVENALRRVIVRMCVHQSFGAEKLERKTHSQALSLAPFTFAVGKDPKGWLLALLLQSLGCLAPLACQSRGWRAFGPVIGLAEVGRMYEVVGCTNVSEADQGRGWSGCSG